ncbi:hypothetical protein M422DRAFT_199136 [Sphaerobolus stellatus SS14]|nr:hypothetical protein M422DRAFT_199136 [Sphaerobolus stellatus SS14]
MPINNSKKRPASSQGGPASKKPYVQKQEQPKISKSALKTGTKNKAPIVSKKPSNQAKASTFAKEKETNDKKGKKRAVPVTAEVKEDAADSDDDANASDFEEEWATEEEGVEEDVMDVDETNNTMPNKDPKANHESHVAQKALLVTRRAAKPHAALLGEAKHIWADVRKKDIERSKNAIDVKPSEAKEERRAKVKELMQLVRGKISELVLKHDASRIIQTIVKYGTPEIRLEVAKELEGHYLQLVQGKYSKFLVTKLIRYCPPSRSFIIPELMPEVPRLIHHGYASPVLADAYEVHCTGAERAQLLRAFWGKEAALFGDGISAQKGKKRSKGVEALIDLHEKDKGTKPVDPAMEMKDGGLKAVLTASDDIERRKRTLTAVKENLLAIFNNPSQVAARHAITHRVLSEYLEAVGSHELFPEDKFSEQDRERAWREVFESCQEQLAEMVHTREGGRSVREFLARGTAKDRKQIVKVLKPHVARIAEDDEAQMVLFTALDVIDDTKLTAKQLIAEIIPATPTATMPSSLLSSAAGRRTLLNTIIPRSTRHFTPAIISTLAVTDPIRALTSKKDEKARKEEIRAAASPGLLALVKAKGVEMSKDPKGSLVVSEIMLYAEGDKTAEIDILLAPLSETYPSDDPEKPHPIDIPHTSRVYKTLLQGGHYSKTSNSVEPSPYFDPAAFATAFIRITGRDNALRMAQGGGTFVIAELLERLHASGQGEEVKEWFGAKELQSIKASDVKGKDVLLEKIKALQGK